MPEPPQRPARKEIARYVLARGITYTTEEAEERAKRRVPVDWPVDLAPIPRPFDTRPAEDAPLPRADIAVVTWTVGEADALAEVFTPAFNRLKWAKYARNLDEFLPKIRNGAPAKDARRLGSYLPTQ